MPVCPPLALVLHLQMLVLNLSLSSLFFFSLPPHEHTANMPTVNAPYSSQAFNVANGANHYRCARTRVCVKSCILFLYQHHQPYRSHSLTHSFTKSLTHSLTLCPDLLESDVWLPTTPPTLSILQPLVPPLLLLPQLRTYTHSLFLSVVSVSISLSPALPLLCFEFCLVLSCSRPVLSYYAAWPTILYSIE